MPDITVHGSHLVSEHVSIVKCPLPAHLKQQDEINASVLRNGGLQFQESAVWKDLHVAKTPLEEENSFLVGCLSFNNNYNGLDELLSWLAYHKLQEYSHVFVYDNGPDVDEATLANIKKELQPFVDSKFVTLIPWLINKYPEPMGMVWEDHLYQDCLHRTKGRATFLSNPHSDEYFIPKPAYNSFAVFGQC
jgi:hypothetical protein